MNTYEKDLALASAYLEQKDASVEQLTLLAAKLRSHASRLPFSADYAADVTQINLQALQLVKLARSMQSTLLDDAQRIASIRNDRTLARELGAAPSSVSRVRSAHLCIGATLIISIHELTGWSVRYIKARLNLPSLSSLANQKACAE